MDDLIEALNIVRPYMTEYGAKYPTHCEHDVLILNVDPTVISETDRGRLLDLSFFVSTEFDALVSFKFGSC
jgi:hypothetical protein